MTVLVKFQIEIRFFIELHGSVDDVMSTIICLLCKNNVYSIRQSPHKEWDFGSGKMKWNDRSSN